MIIFFLSNSSILVRVNVRVVESGLQGPKKERLLEGEEEDEGEEEEDEGEGDEGIVVSLQIDSRLSTTLVAIHFTPLHFTPGYL